MAALTALTTFGLYLYLKGDGDEMDADLIRRKTHRDFMASSRTDKIKIRIRKDAIGAVIGKGGENVRNIQRMTRTKITFDEDKNGTGDKYAVIMGDSEAIAYAEEVIMKIVDDQPLLSTLEFSIPCTFVGSVIGRNGEVIRCLQEETGCRISVARLPPNSFSESNPVTLKGTPEQITAAKKRIDGICGTPFSKKSRMYTPWSKEEWDEFGKQPISEEELKDSEEADKQDKNKTFVKQAWSPDKEKPESLESTSAVVLPGVHSSYAAAVIEGGAETFSSASSTLISPADTAQIRPISVSDKSIGTSPNNSWTNSSDEPASPECHSIPYDVLLDEPLHEELIATLDDALHVYVSHIESPSKFWLQIVGPKATALDKLSNDMTDYYEVNARREKVTHLRIGDVVASTFTPQDETWYRARVMDITEKHPHEDTEVMVFYLDFGGESVHKKKNLCNLKHDFLTALPFQAVESILWGVQPIDEDWSEEAVNAFSQAVHCSEWTEILCRPKGKVKVPFGKTSGLQTAVELIDFKSSPPVDIAQYLMNKGFARKKTTEATIHATSSDTSDSGL